MERIISDEPMKECDSYSLLCSIISRMDKKISTNVCSHHSHYKAEMLQWESIG